MCTYLSPLAFAVDGVLIYLAVKKIPVLIQDGCGVPPGAPGASVVPQVAKVEASGLSLVRLWAVMSIHSGFFRRCSFQKIVGK